MPTLLALPFWTAITPLGVLLVERLVLLGLPTRLARAWVWRVSLAIVGLSLVALAYPTPVTAGAVTSNRLSVCMTLLVHTLCMVISRFSARTLAGERHEARFWPALVNVQLAVQLLLISNRLSLTLIAYSAIGFALERLLCFYPERPVAVLAARKKFLADRLADAIGLVVILGAWGIWADDRLSTLAHQNASADALVAGLTLVVVLRSALMPAHGWLIQVMEAPTPVSALLHAGVINLGGYLIIQNAALWTPAAQTVLVVTGMLSALGAAACMTTRISIKVRLAWSTLAQMGFMLVECGLGLYSFAWWHLLGHSLYKAHAFLSASNAVADTEQRRHLTPPRWTGWSILTAPLWSGLTLIVGSTMLQALGWSPSWPWWWTVALAVLSAPLMWQSIDAPRSALRLLHGCGLTLLTFAVLQCCHHLPLGISDHPNPTAGLAVAVVLTASYALWGLWSRYPSRTWHRLCFAGFYLDEHYTRLTLRTWPRAVLGDAHDPRP